MTPPGPGTAVLVIAHGSRRPGANADAEFVAAHLRQLGDYQAVAPAYLELATPDILTAGSALAAGGAGRVVMVPYFLSPGVHVAEDLEAARAELARRHPGVEFRLARPLGRHPLVLDVVAERAREAAGLGRHVDET